MRSRFGREQIIGILRERFRSFRSCGLSLSDGTSPAAAFSPTPTAQSLSPLRAVSLLTFRQCKPPVLAQ
jgi:hypothetical protein